ncbi:IS1595 family transposase [Collinsella tanakaei]|uniref:IS1595 family transposase n=1 Tax=Collinsella tanakaei TaxID=626935 RepID=UPI00248D6044|nr:IS1595 family transposase [Collinsella tanakaei]
MQHRVDALDVPLEVAVRRIHVLPSSLSSCDACTRFAARGGGVSLKTSFSMRHRLCEVMVSMLPAFEAGPGCPVEADETLVPDSLSGNHSRSAGFPCPRPARRRGGDGAAAGVSSDKVSVLTMVNARGDAMAVAARRGKMGVADARRAMAGCALEGAVVSTDRQRGYVRALAEMGVAAHERFASSGPRAPLNRVNALHSALKAFLARFRGVSTRRLPNYLAWLCWAREARWGGDIPDELARALTAAVPVPPGDFHVIGGLTQPRPKRSQHL